jgi:hypothetical protein
MTYDQYQQIYNAAKAQIADRVSKLQPRAGNNASVNGMGISIEVGGAEEAAAEDTWRYVLLGQVVGSTTIGGSFDVGPENAAVVFRDGFVASTYFWQETQLFNMTPDEGADYSRTYNLILTSASVNEDSSEGEFKFPTKVVLELYPTDENGLPLEPVAEYNFFVGFDGDHRAFVAPEPNIIYGLRIKSIERTA